LNSLDQYTARIAEFPDGADLTLHEVTATILAVQRDRAAMSVPAPRVSRNGVGLSAPLHRASR